MPHRPLSNVHVLSGYVKSTGHSGPVNSLAVHLLSRRARDVSGIDAPTDKGAGKKQNIRALSPATRRRHGGGDGALHYSQPGCTSQRGHTGLSGDRRIAVTTSVTGLVRQRQVRDLHSLGHLLGACVAPVGQEYAEWYWQHMNNPNDRSCSIRSSRPADRPLWTIAAAACPTTTSRHRSTPRRSPLRPPSSKRAAASTRSPTAITRRTPDDQYATADELIDQLVDIVSKHGNFLLDPTRPDCDGARARAYPQRRHDQPARLPRQPVPSEQGGRGSTGDRRPGRGAAVRLLRLGFSRSNGTADPN
jgi:hypothetical protein